MSGYCMRCHRPTATRSEPLFEGRLDFVKEGRGIARLICKPCIRYSLPANVAA